MFGIICLTLLQLMAKTKVFDQFVEGLSGSLLPNSAAAWAANAISSFPDILNAATQEHRANGSIDGYRPLIALPA